MAVVKRAQGRPFRGAGDVGRDRLIEAARTILRGRGRTEISRKAVADAAGVTPALVTYYFPGKDSLALAATQPLIGARIAEVNAILSAPTARTETLRRLVAFFVGTASEEAELLDYAVEVCLRDSTDPTRRAMMIATYRHLKSFYLDGVDAGAWRAVDPDFFLFALWGLCRATTGVAAAGDEIGANAASREERIDMIVDLVTHGLKHAVAA